MTPAEELWQAVVKHCASGRGYSIELRRDTVELYLTKSKRWAYVFPVEKGWCVTRHTEESRPLYSMMSLADNAVAAAVEYMTK